MKTVGSHPTVTDLIATPTNSTHAAEQQQIESRLSFDDRARTLAMRHARFDPDRRALAAPPDQAPDMLGFEMMPGGYHWTARGLFDLTGFPSAPPPQSTLTRPRFHDLFDDIWSEQQGGRIGGDRGDPLHLIPQLRQIRVFAEVGFARATLDPTLAFRLAVALGSCRLFGVSVSDAEDFTLSPSGAILAACSTIERLLEQERMTENPPADAESVLKRLEARMELWAASIALEEASEAAAHDPAPEIAYLDQLLKTIRRRIGRLDNNLQRHIPLLRPAAGTYLLENWRRLLAPAHRNTPPWWLDGCIG
jgi:hypothetical protein